MEIDFTEFKKTLEILEYEYKYKHSKPKTQWAKDFLDKFLDDLDNKVFFIEDFDKELKQLFKTIDKLKQNKKKNKPVCGACGRELSCPNGCDSKDSPHGIVSI